MFRLPRIPYLSVLLLPWALFAIGFSLNAVATASNHNQMPVLTADCEDREDVWNHLGDEIHTCMTEKTHAKIVSDIILIPTVGTASVGDLFEFAYSYLIDYIFYIWAFLIILDYNRKENESY